MRNKSLMTLAQIIRLALKKGCHFKRASWEFPIMIGTSGKLIRVWDRAAIQITAEDILAKDWCEYV